MPRFAAGLEYDGRAYSGWQFQPGLKPSRTSCNARCRASRMLRWNACARDAPMPACTRCAQVVHFDSDAVRSERGWRLGANYLSTRRRERRLGARSAAGISTRATARWRAAIATSSSTAIRVRRWPPGAPPGSAGRSTRRACTRPRRRWSANTTSARFAPSSARRNRRCAASSASRSRAMREWLTLAITANAFLHHMVRNVAGLLMSVGHGESPPERVAAVLASRDRKINAATAPPDGLYLAAVRYPAEFGLPGRPASPMLAMRRNPLSSAALRPTHQGFAAEHVLVRENHALADQDRAPHAFGARGSVDQVFGLRRRAVPRRARAQSQRLSEVQPSHAHRRARAARRAFSTKASRWRSAPTSRPKIRSSFATASVTATASRRRRRRPASATR